MMDIWEITSDICKQYAENGGDMEVHRSWRDNMINHGREVSCERMNWETLPFIDRKLDENIAFDIAWDFIGWLQCRYGDHDDVQGDTEVLGA